MNKTQVWLGMIGLATIIVNQYFGLLRDREAKVRDDRLTRIAASTETLVNNKHGVALDVAHDLAKTVVALRGNEADIKMAQSTGAALDQHNANQVSLDEALNKKGD